MKKIIYMLSILLILTGCNQKDDQKKLTEIKVDQGSKALYLDSTQLTELRVEDLLSKMSLDDKAGQMVQVEIATAKEAINAERLKGVGSVLSGGGGAPPNNTPEGWAAWIKEVQKETMATTLRIPSLYGIDSVHGHATVTNATIFPHNIGLGAANEPDLTEKMGAIVANEMFLTRIPWNFGPCVAIAEDPRWGRSYESYSTDIQRTSALGVAYLKGFDGAGGVSTAKHFLGDGNTVYGTGLRGGNDQGDTQLSLDEIRKTILIPYKEMIDSGVQIVMTSFSSVNGLKMHNHKELLTDILKGELGFKGFVITDWEGIHHIPNLSYKEQVWASINAGNDMLMEPYKFQQARAAIVEGVENGEIDIERVDDAVRRILTVKFNLGLFEDPTINERAASAKPLRDPESLAVARELVEKSMVLVKNENNILPIKSGQKILLLGPAANNIGMQCGGWTKTWQGVLDRNERKITEGTTLLESLTTLSKEMNFTLVTDPGQGADADLVLIALGETPYSEMEGDNPSPDLTGKNAHPKNKDAIETAKSMGKPTVALIIAGRHVAIDPYINDWDGVVMAYLPGTEGDGMGRVLTAKAPFTGTLPMPWYKKINGERKEEFETLFELGYGLEY